MSFIALNRANKYLSTRIGNWLPPKPITVAIHGFGVIGKAFFIAQQLIPGMRKRIAVTLINDKSNSWANHLNLINCPSIYGETGINAKLADSTNIPEMILDNGMKIDLLSESKNSKLPLENIDFLLDTSGDSSCKDRKYFESFLHSGARRVILPNFHSEMDKNIIIGFNEEQYSPSKHSIVGCGSCSLNLQVLLLGLLANKYTLRAVLLEVLHCINTDQSVTDIPHPKSHGLLGRATGDNFIIVPSGSLGNIADFFPEIKGNIQAINVRIPVSVGMAIHSVIKIDETTHKDEVNSLIAKASSSTHKGLIRLVSKEDAFTSAQTKANPESAIVDISQTAIMDGNLIKLLAWQDPFIGYATKILETILLMAYKETEKQA